MATNLNVKPREIKTIFQAVLIVLSIKKQSNSFNFKACFFTKKRERIKLYKTENQYIMRQFESLNGLIPNTCIVLVKIA